MNDGFQSRAGEHAERCDQIKGWTLPPPYTQRRSVAAERLLPAWRSTRAAGRRAGRRTPRG
ncbi:hypothetical protein PLANPX_0984 [Lacipirellula parvula]|uniref:Uncharacterized protein n=1 Tax=Lacipirellula parvula TaxID=2650471 RepID=A0A5K7X6D1_9BACT|nr:hypothetical protein PLANPX_0984 [Lacipirellula parvula]